MSLKTEISMEFCPVAHLSVRTTYKSETL